MTFTFNELITIANALDYYALHLNKQMDAVEDGDGSIYQTLEELDDALWAVENITEEIDDEIFARQIDLGVYEMDEFVDDDLFAFDLWDDVEMYEEIEEDEYSVIA